MERYSFSLLFVSQHIKPLETNDDENVMFVVRHFPPTCLCPCAHCATDVKSEHICRDLMV